MGWMPKLKKLCENLPEPIGHVLAHIPYSLRPGLGGLYRRRRREILTFSHLSAAAQKHEILIRMQRIVRFAADEVPFYHETYAKAGFVPDSLRSFDDIQRIPVISKEQLRKWSLEDRSYVCPGCYLENTGGSSGSPLEFYILPASVPHEWAHMHRVWANLGYKPSSLKLCFGGRNLKDQAVAYDGLRHHYAVNIYHRYPEVAAVLKRVLAKQPVRFLHGYPSALYDFACYCETEDRELRRILAGQLVGAFLSSEYPTPQYRNKIESVFEIDSVSWYGHTERAVLAWEREAKYRYEPFHTYGYAEAVRDPNTGDHKLVATSYYNTASPFIRYDTGDQIHLESVEYGLLRCFTIAGGREGDFVTDRNGKRIPLTGLIFGRHHPLFESARFVQIGQTDPGKVTLFITPKGQLDAALLPKLFDATGVEIDFDYQIIDEPIKSKSGKVILKVRMEERK